MSLAEPPSPPGAGAMTAEELLALPDDGMDREIIRGELRERVGHYHTPSHGRAVARFATALATWNDVQTPTRGEVHCGATFRLQRTPDTLIGSDLAYVPPALAAATAPRASFFDGPPALAVEILSPSDTHEDVVAKVALYLEAGTVVWVVDPDFQIVTVHRPGAAVETFNVNQELSGEPYLPGFRVRVEEIFG